MELFDFEKEFAAALKCIPMGVRFKLDQSGVKVSLRQWARLSLEDRERLLTMAFGSPGEVSGYRKHVIDLISTRAEEIPKDMAVETDPQWEKTSEVPEQLKLHAEASGVTPPTPEQWAALSTLQRFALLKLAREGHENRNFIPAMQEFDLV